MPVAQISRWKTLETWSPREVQEVTDTWPVHPLGKLIEYVHAAPYTPAVEEIVQFAGVRWYGQGLFVREERAAAAVKGRCFPLHPGMLVYNRLFAWKSAFAIVPPEMDGVVVSNEFPQFRVDKSAADPEFVRLVCISSQFAAAVGARSTGTTAISRNRLRESDFLSLVVPLPPLDLQQKFVSEYSAQVAEANALVHQAEERQKTAWRAFEEGLGAPTSRNVPISSSATIARFADLTRWDGAATNANMDLRWPTAPLEAHADIRLGCQVPRRGDRGPGVEHPYLRAANVQLGWIDFSDVKKMRVPDRVAEGLAIQDGDLLFVEGNSQEEVGRSAVWAADEDYIFQNSVIRARTDSAVLDPWFACAWFNSGPGRRYFQENATTTTGTLWHIGAGKTAKAPVPVPPIETQQELATSLWSDVKAAAAEKSRASELRKEAARRFSANVFGQTGSCALPAHSGVCGRAG